MKYINVCATFLCNMAPRISPNYNHISLYKNYEKLHIQYSVIYYFSAVPQSNNLSQPDDSNKY